MPNARAIAIMTLAAALLSGCASRSRDVPKPMAPPEAVVAPEPAPMPAPEPMPAPPPPPPPAAMSDAGEGSSDEVIVTGSRRSGGVRTGAVRGKAVSPAPLAMSGDVRRPRPEPQRQSGLLTAGDHDDLLNPALYARYAAKFLQNNNQPRLPLLDTNARIKVRVADRSGRPAPFVRVDVARPNAAPLTLYTAADGAVSLLPSLDGTATRLTLTITPPGGAAFTRTIVPTDRIAAIELPAPARGVRKFDLLLNVDTTGSMGDELSYLKAELASIVARLRSANPSLDIRVGLLVYRDQGDDYVTRSFPLTSDIAALQTSLAAQQSSGGGDYPEAVDQSLVEAAKFDWRPDAVKAMLFVADAPPHDDRMAASWDAAMALRARGVHIVPVGASGVGASAEYLMRSMAALTQSRYVFLTDDSGVGLPHQDPDVPCYLVTRLDGLVGRVLAGLATGTRVEPAPGEVIREVGDYDKGLCLPSRRPRPEPRR